MSYSWKKLDFDTELFGYPIAKIEQVDNKNSVQALIEELKKNAIEYASFRINTKESQVISELQNNHFKIVDALIAMDLLIDSASPLIDTVHVRSASLKDKKKLYSLASESFTVNRFYNDDFFLGQRSKVKGLFGKWAENSLTGSAADHVLVYEQDGDIAGFISIQNSGHIPLLAVRADQRGKGIAKDLLQSAIDYLKTKGIKKIAIETVIMNLPALRSYQSLGFKITETFFTFAWHNATTHDHH